MGRYRNAYRQSSGEKATQVTWSVRVERGLHSMIGSICRGGSIGVHTVCGYRVRYWIESGLSGRETSSVMPHWQIRRCSIGLIDAECSDDRVVKGSSCIRVEANASLPEYSTPFPWGWRQNRPPGSSPIFHGFYSHPCNHSFRGFRNIRCPECRPIASSNGQPRKTGITALLVFGDIGRLICCRYILCCI